MRRLGLVLWLVVLVACSDDGASTTDAVGEADRTTTVPVGTTTIFAGTTTTGEVTSLAAYPLEFDRLGPVVVGMTVEEATAAAGIEFHVNSLSAASPCSFITPLHGTGVVFIAHDGRIRIISVTEPVRTADGLGLGSSEAEVLAVHGDRAVAGPSRLGGRRVDVRSADASLDAFRMVFEFANNGSAATQLRAGDTPLVLTEDEGCA